MCDIVQFKCFTVTYIVSYATGGTTPRVLLRPGVECRAWVRPTCLVRCVSVGGGDG